MYQMLNVTGLSSMEAARSVAVSLGIAQAPQQYEYFEITTLSAFLGRGYQYLITNRNSGELFWRESPPANCWGSIPGEPVAGNQHSLDVLRDYAKTAGLEELPEKGAKWYSYRFRRKKQ